MSRQPRQARGATATAKDISKAAGSTKSSSKVALGPSELIDALANVATTDQVVIDALNGHLKGGSKSKSGETSRSFSMKAVNAVLGALSEVHKSGWTMEKPIALYGAQNISSSTLGAQKCLKYLRSSPSQSTERVALALVARLIAIRMFHEAWILLCDIKTGLTCLYDHQNTQSESATPAMPLPINPATTEQELVLLIVTYLCYSVQVLIRMPKNSSPPHESFDRLSTAIVENEDGLLLQWITISPNKQTSKQLYTLCTSVLKGVEAKATTVDPRVWCPVRFYMVRCVLHVSSHDDLSWVWKLLQNISASYIKATAGNLIAFTQLHSDLVACVTIIQSRGELSTLLKDTSFKAFHHQWSGLAVKASDAAAVHFLSNLVVSSANNGSADSSSDLIDRISKFGSEIQVFIEASKHETIKDSINLILPDLRSSTAMISQMDTADDARRLFRAVERYRRGSKPLYEKMTFQSLRNGLRQIAAHITKLYTAILEKFDSETQLRSEVLAAILESSILSSKCTLLVTDAGTFDSAFDDLALALKVLDHHRAQGSGNFDDNRIQDFYRCLSGAFWNLGSQLYQASRWDHAVPFITRSIDIDRNLLQIGSRKREDSVWKQFFEQMPKRLLVLANCFSKINNRRRTYELNNDALRCLLKLHWQELELRSASLPSIKVLEDPKFELISATIDRITFLGAAELMIGKDVLLHTLVDGIEASPLVAGVVLERQIHALRDLWWKKEIQSIVVALFIASNGYYASYPIRLARLYLTELEFHYYTRLSWDEAKQIGLKALDLLSQENLVQEESLSRYKLQYRSGLHLWLVCHAHIGQDLSSVRSHAELALEIFSSFTMAPSAQGELTPDPKVGKNNTRPKPGAKGERKVSTTQAASATRIPQALKAPQKKTPVRKPAKARDPSRTAQITAEPLIVSPPRPNEDMYDLDDPSGFWSLIEMALNLFGALGFLDLRLLYLDRCVNLLKAKGHVVSNDFYAKLLIRSAHEFDRLGKVNHAMELYSKSLTIINEGTFNLQVKLVFLLRFAGFLARFGEHEKSLELYGEANDLAVDMEWNNPSNSSLEKAQSRIRRYYYAATACSTYANIQLRKNEPYTAWRGYMQALRLWHSAIELMQKFTVNHAPRVEERNPFQMEDLAEALPEAGEANSRSGGHNNPGPSGWNWVLAEGLYDTYLSLSKYQMDKGNYRDAEYFILQAHELANSLNATTSVVQALCFQAELAIHLGHYDDAHELLRKGEQYNHQVMWLEAAQMLLVQGIYSECLKSEVDASLLLTKAESKLRDFNKWIAGEVLLMSEGKAFDDSAPVLLNKILQHQVWLSRDGDNGSLLKRLKELSSIIRAESDENYTIAKLMAYQVHASLESTVTSSSLNESVVSLPFGVHENENYTKQTLEEAINLLDSAKECARMAVFLLQHQGFAANFRESVLTLVNILTSEETLRSNQVSSAINVGFLIDLGAVVTLRRELLENIDSKLASITKSDLEWPTCTQSEEQAAHLVIVSPLSRFDPRADEFDHQGKLDRKYWSLLQTRYLSEISEASWSEALKKLPNYWTVVSISLADTKDALFLSCGRARHQPIIFRIPIGRANRKENSDITGELSFETAKKELSDIIKSSAQNGKRAGQVADQGKSIRAEWWAERKNLDERLRTLLENIEFCWLGGFKAVFKLQDMPPPKFLTSFYARVYTIFKRHAFGNRKDLSPARLEETIMECFSTLPANCKEEELEDLIYYVLDAYQFRGQQISISDIAISEVVAELRAALEELQKASKGKTTPIHNHHLFLVLDRNLQDIPWESIPILRGHSVSRIPSLSFLLDRLELASMRQSEVTSSRNEQMVDRMPFNPARVFYLLNPDGDLKGTESMLKSWLQSMGKIGWKGVVNRKPSELEMHDALTKNDLFIYFGHGGAEQYIRGGKIRSLTRCASTMLWGCSSGVMQDAGQFDRTGTPYNYLLGGCPSLVVNLWDVTDKDIDRFAQSVFQKMHLDSTARVNEQNVEKTSVVKAVAESREVCKLKYLTGAAPVVYGIPIYS